MVRHSGRTTAQRSARAQEAIDILAPAPRRSSSGVIRTPRRPAPSGSNPLSFLRPHTLSQTRPQSQEVQSSPASNPSTEPVRPSGDPLSSYPPNAEPEAEAGVICGFVGCTQASVHSHEENVAQQSNVAPPLAANGAPPALGSEANPITVIDLSSNITGSENAGTNSAGRPPTRMELIQQFVDSNRVPDAPASPTADHSHRNQFVIDGSLYASPADHFDTEYEAIMLGNHPRASSPVETYFPDLFPFGPERCDNPLCPISSSIAHSKGAYFHDGVRGLFHHPAWGWANPPHGIWQAYDRYKEAGNQFLNDEDRKLVDHFATFHYGW